MQIDLKFFYLYAWKSDNNWNRLNGCGLWFRIFGYGLHFNNAPLLFSERNGLTKIYKLPFGFKMKVLKRDSFWINRK